MLRTDHKGAVKIEVVYKSGRVEEMPFDRYSKALPTANKLRSLTTVNSVKIKKVGEK